MGNLLVYTLALCGQYGIYQKDWKLRIKFVLMGGPLFYGHHNFWIRNQHQPIALRLYSYYFFIYFLLVLSLMRIFELQSLMCRVMSIDGLSFKKKKKKLTYITWHNNNCICPNKIVCTMFVRILYVISFLRIHFLYIIH